MKKRNLLIAAVALALAAPALAAGPVGSARENVKDARKELRDARKDGGAVAEAGAALKAAVQNLKETRAERRKAHATELRDRFRDALAKEGAKDQLRIHARRQARLARMRALATEGNKPKLVEQIDALVAKEQERFDRKMEELRAQGAKK